MLTCLEWFVKMQQ